MYGRHAPPRGQKHIGFENSRRSWQQQAIRCLHGDMRMSGTRRFLQVSRKVGAVGGALRQEESEVHALSRTSPEDRVAGYGGRDQYFVAPTQVFAMRLTWLARVVPFRHIRSKVACASG